jgi:hypothetical protein
MAAITMMAPMNMVWYHEYRLAKDMTLKTKATMAVA